MGLLGAEVRPVEVEAPKQQLQRRGGWWQKYPWLPQHDHTDCGAACLARSKSECFLVTIRARHAQTAVGWMNPLGDLSLMCAIRARPVASAM